MIDQQKAKEAYEAYLQKAKSDDRIIGIILAGGRGKGAFSENSDYDVILVTNDEGFESVKKITQKRNILTRFHTLSLNLENMQKLEHAHSMTNTLLHITQPFLIKLARYKNSLMKKEHSNQTRFKRLPTTRLVVI